MHNWIDLGRILKPNKKKKWYKTHTGPSFIDQKNSTKKKLIIYFSGRDKNNISHIGKFIYSLKNQKIISQPKKILSPGKYGFFDQYGVSYPCIIENFMFYVGWIADKKIPFQNRLGLAQKNGKKLRKTPILNIDEEDPLNIGSCFILKKDKYMMWYTSFLKYKKIKNKNIHFYTIKYAESNNLFKWKKKGIVIKLKKNEIICCKPSVIYFKKKYHMWFCSRGKNYNIQYAQSSNGIDWKRNNLLSKFNLIKKKWNSNAMSYPSVFKINNNIYMTYNGNNYGKNGIGLLKLEL